MFFGSIINTEAASSLGNRTPNVLGTCTIHCRFYCLCFELLMPEPSPLKRLGFFMTNIFTGKNVVGLTIKTNRIDYGYVYVLEFDAGAIKIGMTKKPKNRVNDIESSTGVKIRNVALTIPHLNYRKNEELSHSMFANKRVKGEWFNVDFLSVVEFIDNLDFDVESEIEYSDRTRLKEESKKNATNFVASHLFGVNNIDKPFVCTDKLNCDKDNILLNSNELIAIEKIRFGISVGDLLSLPRKTTYNAVIKDVYEKTNVDYSYLLKHIENEEDNNYCDIGF